MTSPRTNHSPLPTLLACAVIGCMVILAVYWLRAPNPILARLSHAVMISGVSLVIAWPIAAWLKLSRKWTVVVYVILFLLTIFIQNELR